MRLFVAVNLPAEERRAVHDATEALRAGDLPVGWEEPEKLHVTIQFLGNVDGGQAEPIGDALVKAVGHLKPFDVTIGGAGAFPDAAHPRVLWIGVEKHPALELLAHDVARAMGGFGFEPELRPFHPHVTIGRVRKDAAVSTLGGVGAALESVDYASVIAIERVDLMESLGGRYRVLRSASLGGGS